MTLKAKFAKELAGLGVGNAVVLSAQDNVRHLTCRITERNALAVAFECLDLQSSELATVSVADLQRLSEALSGRLTYLLEPIAPIEADADRCVVQMRSNPPRKDDDGRSYYELIVARGGGITLRRYRKEPGQARHGVSATVTCEVLTRLVGDLEEALDTFRPEKR